MELRKLGQSDLHVSVIAFGAWAIGGWMWGGENIMPIADGHNVTLSQLVLNWTILQPGITCALAGARNPAQVLENAGAARFKLTGEEIEIINNKISNLQIDTKI